MGPRAVPTSGAGPGMSSALSPAIPSSGTGGEDRHRTLSYLLIHLCTWLLLYPYPSLNFLPPASRLTCIITFHLVSTPHHMLTFLLSRLLVIVTIITLCWLISHFMTAPS